MTFKNNVGGVCPETDIVVFVVFATMNNVNIRKKHLTNKCGPVGGRSESACLNAMHFPKKPVWRMQRGASRPAKSW